MRKLAMIVLSCLILAATSTATAQAGVARNRQIIRSYFGSSRTAQCTAHRESRFVASATGYNKNQYGQVTSKDLGLFQINDVTWQGEHVWYFDHVHHHGVDIHIDTAKLHNPTYNVRVTWAITKGGKNWGPWNGGCSYPV